VVKGLLQLSREPAGLVPAPGRLGSEGELFLSPTLAALYAHDGLELGGGGPRKGRVTPARDGRADKLVYGVGADDASAVPRPLGGGQAATGIAADGTGA
jgi:hypothetical protein